MSERLGYPSDCVCAEFTETCREDNDAYDKGEHHPMCPKRGKHPSAGNPPTSARAGDEQRTTQWQWRGSEWLWDCSCPGSPLLKSSSLVTCVSCGAHRPDNPPAKPPPYARPRPGPTRVPGGGRLVEMEAVPQSPIRIATGHPYREPGAVPAQDDAEFQAMRDIVRILSALPLDARRRVAEYVVARTASET